VARKRVLATYDIFDETRYFDPGQEITPLVASGRLAQAPSRGAPQHPVSCRIGAAVFAEEVAGETTAGVSQGCLRSGKEVEE